MFRVLIVEDSTDVRTLLQLALEGEGYAVASVENGKEALHVLAQEAVDFILLDLMMPVMDGSEFLQHKNRDASLRRIPTVVISAIAEAVRLPGVVGFLRKPLNLNELFAILGEHASKRLSPLT